MTQDDFGLDVALSFAGEDRDYVEQVAASLDERGVRYFYDKSEEAELWGKDLYTHLDEVYRRRARYCVMFISEAYGRKLWTNHERESAQARAFEENEEYILPARFDDTEIPGIRPTTGYIDLRGRSPESFADLICQKLGHSAVVAEPDPGFRRPKVSGQSFNPYEEALGFIGGLTGKIKQRCDVMSGDGVSCTVFDREGRTCVRVVLNGETKYSLDVWLGGVGGDDSIGFHGGAGKLTSSPGTSNAWGDIEWSKEADSPVLKFLDLSLLSMMPGDEKYFTFDDFTEAIWDVICDAIEGD